MSVVIINHLKNVAKFSLNVNVLSCHAKRITEIAGYGDFDLGLILVDDTEMLELNKSYRDVDEATDVLAFPFHEIPPERAGNLSNVCEEEKMLGDIVLGMPYIQRKAEEHGTGLVSDLMTHITHGVCHLVGYDHNTPDAWTAMYNKELYILQKFNKETGMTCAPLLKVGHYYYDDT